MAIELTFKNFRELCFCAINSLDFEIPKSQLAAQFAIYNNKEMNFECFQELCLRHSFIVKNSQKSVLCSPNTVD